MQSNVTHFQEEKKKSMKADLQIVLILELVNNIKAVIIAKLNELRENILLVNR